MPVFLNVGLISKWPCVFFIDLKCGNWQVTEDQRYTLIEYISHLVNSDYARVAEDLVRLGFVPPEFVDPEKTASVVPQLSRVLGQLTQGGGARKVNVQQVCSDPHYL